MDDRGSGRGIVDRTVLFVDDAAKYQAAGREYLEGVEAALTVLPETTGGEH